MHSSPDGPSAEGCTQRLHGEAHAGQGTERHDEDGTGADQQIPHLDQGARPRPRRAHTSRAPSSGSNIAAGQRSKAPRMVPKQATARP